MPTDSEVRYMLTDDPRRTERKLHPSTPLLDRVLLRSSIQGDCWVFGGALTRGYGVIRARRLGLSPYAHHVTFDALVGTPRDGLWVDHLCRNPACCNPSDMELVTPGENTRRGYWAHGGARATHCKAGHEYSLVGVYIKPADGRRVCLVCHRGWLATNNERIKAKRRLARNELG